MGVVVVLTELLCDGQSQKTEPLGGITGGCWLQAGCPFCHPTESVKALKEQAKTITIIFITHQLALGKRDATAFTMAL